MGSGQKQKIDQIISWLDRCDYFEILNVKHDATSHDVKRAYLGLSRQYHPDKFFSKVDPVTMAKITLVFKRLNEAYAVLKDSKKRKKYIEKITGPDRQQFLRFRVTQEDREGPANPEDFAKTPNGKKYLKLALVARARKDWDKVEINLNFALGFEPDNEELKKLLSQAKAEYKKMPKENPFKIK